MSIDCDPAVIEDDTTAESATMTLERARYLAAALAPHLAAMRAVTAGTCYESEIGIEIASESASVGDLQALSPTTMIFIAGMLDRVSA